ncbi:hypothetical protein M422DRAFT_263997 [Sphaerobolus stellatus SS14]|uniref:Uncharacterized protein n=1 Tax=Sphaerobolus stellatus (strain SS14) TaxID=990650 RepID=A0A0C9V986_SPHS4|nr:hypothetical protein M422DRAFT_263997 [Sphaerobolus stellatus SS14]
MSSSSKPTTANAVLYKKSKDVPILPPVRLTDARRTLSGFQAVPGFKGQKDPSRGETWAEADTDERTSIVAGYWCAYDKDYVELNNLFLSLKKKEEAAAEQKRKAEEKKKEAVVPVASGFGKGKGKLKETVLDIDLESEVEGEFRETCLNCEENKTPCIFMYPTAGNTASIEGFSPDENMRKTLEVSPIFTVFSSEENIVRKYNFSKVFNADLSIFSLGKTLKEA